MAETSQTSTSFILLEHLSKLENADVNSLVSIDLSNFIQIFKPRDEYHACVIGGLSEGTSIFPKDDVDTMIIPNDTLVTEPTQEVICPANQLVFRMEYIGDRPGFVYLKLISGYPSFELCVPEIKSSFVDIANKGKYLSSSMIKEKLLHLTFDNVEAQCHATGPAINIYSGIHGDHQNIKCPVRNENGEQPTPQIDGVLSFFCQEWPKDASAWATRVCNHSWPSQEMVMAIKNSGCFVVPKGSHGGEFHGLEWCISFAPHEKCLVRSFNSVQRKHYILLKKILKNKFYDKYKNVMTSYLAKTICLWQVEINRESVWKAGFLVERMIQSLLFLRDCISRRQLPHYFIPENNILFGKLTTQTRNILLEELTTFTNVIVSLSVNSRKLIEFLFGRAEPVDYDIGLRCVTYYNFSPQVVNDNEISSSPMSFSRTFSSAERMHESIFSTFEVWRKQKIFKYIHTMLLKSIIEVQSHKGIIEVQSHKGIIEVQSHKGNRQQYLSRHYLMQVLPHFSKTGGFSSQVRTAEIYLFIGQSHNTITIIKKALSHDISFALKGEKDIRAKSISDLSKVMNKRSQIPLCEFLSRYIIAPITLSEDVLNLWCGFLQQDIFRIVTQRPIKVDALAYAYFLLAQAYRDVFLLEKVDEAISSLIEVVSEETSKLDHKLTALCLLEYSINITSKP